MGFNDHVKSTMYRKHPLRYHDWIQRTTGGTPLDKSLVYGVDTESFHSIRLGHLHTAMVTVSDDEGDKVYEPALHDSPFRRMMDDVFDRHAEEMTGKLRRSQTELKREAGKRGKGRAKMPTVLFAFYNLEYDFQRMFLPDSEMFKLARVNVEGVKIEQDGYELENVHMVLSGSAPHFTWILRKDNKVLKVMAIDLWGYLKQGLGNSAKALGLIDKIEVDKEYFHIPLEELTEEQLEELRVYAKRDSKVTRELYLALLEFLVTFSAAVITKKGTIPPSAPGAAARICFSALEKNSLYQPPKLAITQALEAYNGGLVFCRATGEFENILVGDRNSAYPTMMTLLPNPERVKYVVKYNVKPDDLVGKIGFVRASFTVISEEIPFITSHTEGNGASNHACGRYEQHTISIYELMAGHLTGMITDIHAHEAVYMVYDEDAIGTGIFYDFIKYFHDLKNRSEKGSAMYLLAKLLMNALYGKLIEMRNPETLILAPLYAKMRIPTGIKTKIDTDMNYKYKFYNCLMNYGEGIEELIEDYKIQPDDGWIPIEEAVSDISLDAGTYFFPFYASLITAGQRAWMSVYTYHVNALLADTDSAFTSMSEKEFNDALQKADILTQQIGVGRCRVGKELGDIDIELCNGRGFISGIKQYALHDSDNPSKTKIAHHTILAGRQLSETEDPMEAIRKIVDYRDEKGAVEPSIILVHKHDQTKDDFYTEVIRHLSRGKTVTYETKLSPVKMRTALARGEHYGRFENQIRTITPKVDSRMLAIAKVDKISYYRWRGKDMVEGE